MVNLGRKTEGAGSQRRKETVNLVVETIVFPFAVIFFYLQQVYTKTLNISFVEFY
jgi:hypothetical protein